MDVIGSGVPETSEQIIKEMSSGDEILRGRSLRNCKGRRRPLREACSRSVHFLLGNAEWRWMMLHFLWQMLSRAQLFTGCCCIFLFWGFLGQESAVVVFF